MYYIVYILENNAYAIVPENWIKDIDDHKEKFLNYSINSNQAYVCFWTQSRAARFPNRMLKLDFEPNFNLGFGRIFPAEGNYLCKIIKAKAVYSQAVREIARKRVAPAIYNPDRLFEQPIPVISTSGLASVPPPSLLTRKRQAKNDESPENSTKKPKGICEFV